MVKKRITQRRKKKGSSLSILIHYEHSAERDDDDIDETKWIFSLFLCRGGK